MDRSRYSRVLLGVSLALSLLALLWGSLVAGVTVRAQSSTTQGQSRAGSTTATPELIGRLFFTDSRALRTGSFTLEIRGLPTPPSDSRYTLWLDSDKTAALHLGALPLLTKQATLQGSIGRNPLTIYDRALISLEADNDKRLSGPVLLTATLPFAWHSLLQQLLVENASPLAATGIISGWLTGAQTQAQLAVKHTGFLREQLSKDNLPEARRHTEHIINILDGKEGALYSDLDRNGQLQNPGDGVGVRTYLEGAQVNVEELLALTESVAAAETDAPLFAALTESQATIPIAFERALKIFASDTVTEANTHAHDLAAIVDGLAQQVTSVYTQTLQRAAYPFYLPTTPLVLPTPASRATREPSSTAATSPTTSLRVTGNISEAVSAIPTLATDHLHEELGAPVQPDLEISIAVGTSWRNPADGSLYIYVTGGEYLLGADDGASSREKPQHRVPVVEFWLQQSETTNAQYARCVNAGICTAPANERWSDPDYANHPVTQITWQQAGVYAAWVGGRLPTEAEWEAACRGAEGHEFPWGNEAPDDKRSNYNGRVGDTAPVGSYPAGASPSGLVDLSGNVWEWVSTLDARYPYNATDGREAATGAGKRVARGGSFYYTQYQIRCAARTGFPPETTSQPIGVRVVIDQPLIRRTHAVDGATYLYIAGGEFMMGSTDADAISAREKPRHAVTVGDFWLQATETTNAQYARCVTAGSCTPPNNERWSDPAYADHPVINITWQQATAYAAWVGGRLPTEAEWEKVCRGPDNRTYPWGEEPPSDAVSNYDNSVGDTRPVGAYPAGASAAGALDLSGNVWEWVSSLEAAYPYVATDGREDADAAGKRIVRGGSFYYTQYQIRCAARTGLAPATDDQPIGVRVVLTSPQ